MNNLQQALKSYPVQDDILMGDFQFKKMGPNLLEKYYKFLIDNKNNFLELGLDEFVNLNKDEVLDELKKYAKEFKIRSSLKYVVIENRKIVGFFFMTQPLNEEIECEINYYAMTNELNEKLELYLRKWFKTDWMFESISINKMSNREDYQKIN